MAYPPEPGPRGSAGVPAPPAAWMTAVRAGCVFVLVWAAAVLAAHLTLPWPLAVVTAVLAAVTWGWTVHAASPAANQPDAVDRPSAIAVPPPDAPATPFTPAPAPAPQAQADGESLAYTVSHDLRAPIRVIEGFTRIVREDYGHLLDRVGNDHLERVLGAAGRMNQMIDSLLALARLSTQPLVREPVDLSRLATQVMDELRAQAPQRQAQVRIAPAVRVEGDPTSLRTVMENLLGNAWKYTTRREVAEIEFGITVVDGRPACFVRDNGAGFDMRFADRLFGPFQRLHSASEFQGTGVGLASVQRILRRHGGDIWADAAVNRGATFYFTVG